MALYMLRARLRALEPTDASQFERYGMFGPATEAALIRTIANLVGEMQVKQIGDLEIMCADDDFWFGLHEKEELRRCFKENADQIYKLFPKIKIRKDGASEETDLTETVTETARDLSSGVASQKGGGPYEDVQDFYGRDLRGPSPPSAARSFEHLLLWKVLIWVLAFLTGVMLYGVFDRLKNG